MSVKSIEEYEQVQFKKQNSPQKKLAKKLEENKEKLITDFNPFTEKTIDRNVRLLCYPITFIILYNFISDYKSIRSIIKLGYWNSSTILPLMPYLFVPIGIYYFWKKQKFGWSVIAIWLVLLTVSIVMSYIWELQAANNEFLSRFFHKRGLSYYLLSFLIFGGLLFYINTKKITRVFNISKNFQLQIGAIAIFFVLLHIVTIYF